MIEPIKCSYCGGFNFPPYTTCQHCGAVVDYKKADLQSLAEQAAAKIVMDERIPVVYTDWMSNVGPQDIVPMVDEIPEELCGPRRGKECCYIAHEKMVARFLNYRGYHEKTLVAEVPSPTGLPMDYIYTAEPGYRLCYVNNSDYSTYEWKEGDTIAHKEPSHGEFIMAFGNLVEYLHTDNPKAMVKLCFIGEEEWRAKMKVEMAEREKKGKAEFKKRYGVDWDELHKEKTEEKKEEKKEPAKKGFFDSLFSQS